jgi:protein SCO1/2
MRSAPGRLALAAAVVAVLALAGAGAWAWLSRGEPAAGPAASQGIGGLRAGAFEPAHPAPTFSLAGSDGSPVMLERYRGKVVLLSFGFTSCAAVCPTTLATLAQARKQLGRAGDQVQVIFVTVDPARDDAAHLQSYLSAFDPTFVGATGSDKELARVRAKYGVTAVRQGEGPDYAMAHTSSIFLIDRAGRLRGVMPYGHEADDFVHDVQRLLES